MDKQELYLVPVPGATSSYAPVSHRNVIEAVHEQLYKHNLNVSKEYYNTARFGNQLIGYMDIQRGGNAELGLRLAFRNSYDKSMSVAFVAGANVWICSNGMISGEVQFVRKHTGNVLHEMHDRIVTAINELDDHFNRISKQAEVMKDREVTLTRASHVLGEMFVEKNFIIPTQLSEVKRQLLNPTYKEFHDPTLWSFYNHVTYAFKNSHPLTYIQQHTEFHDYIVDTFKV